MESKRCRVCLSIDSAYTSIKKKYTTDVIQFKGLAIFDAHQLLTKLREYHVDISKLPIWLQCRRGEWVDVTDDNAMLLYLLSGD